MGGGSEVVDAPFLPETQGLVDQNNPPKNENLTLKKGRTWTWNGDKDTLFFVPLHCDDGNSMALRTRPTRTTLKQVSNF